MVTILFDSQLFIIKTSRHFNYVTICDKNYLIIQTCFLHKQQHQLNSTHSFTDN